NPSVKVPLRKSPVSAERSRAVLEALLKGKARLAQSLGEGPVTKKPGERGAITRVRSNYQAAMQ
ncbi:MAG TPA: hypothetical protein PLL57_01995, partial [Flavobacteriales bacterium]|nr:hypothetical protein [Flavobacteriales bacterium]